MNWSLLNLCWFRYRQPNKYVIALNAMLAVPVRRVSVLSAFQEQESHCV